MLKLVAAMHRQNVYLTELTMRCLKDVKERTRPSPDCFASLLERLLREHPEMIAAKKRLKVKEWDKRPPNGRRRKESETPAEK